MVLKRFRPTVFAALALAFTAAAGAGCKEQSLFDEGNDPDGPGPVGTSCPADCLGDAARDFDDSDGAAGERWRYLEDRRDRSWTALTATDGIAVGADPALAITTCQARPSAPACAELPGALLLSSSGASSASDPAIEFKVASKGTLQLGVRAFVSTTDPAQQIVVYRNSREDLLFAGAATPGQLFEQSIAVDALSGDRLLVALVPASGGATDVALELFVSDTGLATRCQVALTFEQVSGTTVNAQCGAAFDSLNWNFDLGVETAVDPMLGAGPFPEMGMAAIIPPSRFYRGIDPLDKSKDFTLQFWMRVVALDDVYIAYPFSDHDLNNSGGVTIDLYEGMNVQLESLTYTGGPDNDGYVGSSAAYPNMDAWKFIRLVHAGDKVAVCVDGRRLFDYDLPVGKLNSGILPHIGKNVVWVPGAFFNGAIDDFRAISAALPCQ